MINKIVSSIVVAVLVLAGSIKAQTAVVSTNGVSDKTIVVPVLTPSLTGIANISISTFTNAPGSIGATFVQDAAAWIIQHGIVSTGPGFTFQGHYGALIGQDIKVFSTGIVGTNEFDIIASHTDFYASKGGCIDEFGIGLSKTMPAPKWLSNFVVITTRPSTINLGISVYIPTTSFSTGHLTKNDVLVGPRIGWSF